MTAFDPIPHFAATYAEARDKFLRDAAKARGLRGVTHHVHPSRSAARRARSWRSTSRCSARPTPATMLLLLSAHARRRRVLRLRLPGRPPARRRVLRAHDVDRRGVRVVLLHALNPYGFSHLRADQRGQRRPQSQLSRLLDAARAATRPTPRSIRSCVPPTWPPSPRERSADRRVRRRARPARAAGGGERRPVRVSRRPVLRRRAAGVEQRRVCGRCCASTRRDARALAWIDFHTGLGPRGHGEKIFAGRASAADLARAKAWWGADVTSFHDGSSTSAPLTGVNYNAAYDECPQADYAGIALEYGTRVVRGSPAGAARRSVARQSSRCARCGRARRSSARCATRSTQDADDWKAMVYAQARRRRRSAR